MKKNIILFFICLLFFSSCVSKENVQIEQDNVIVVSGVVLSDDGESFVINENNDSRSRVSFYVREEGSNSFAYDSLKDFVGDVVSVRAVLLEDSSPWSKIIILTELIVNE